MLKIIMLIFPALLLAQESLTLEKAVAAALENNYGIRISRSNLEIAENNNTPGNAGMLPSVDIAGAYTNTTNNINQVFVDGRIIQTDNASTRLLTAGIQLDWVVFDGLKMFATKDKLEEFRKRGEAQVRNDVTLLAGDIYGKYYEIVLTQEYIKVLSEALKLADQRLVLAKDRLEAGAGSVYQMRQEEIYRNTDQSQLLLQENRLRNLYIDIVMLMGEPTGKAYMINDTNISARELDYESLKKSFEENNPQLEIAALERKIAALQTKEIGSEYFPSVSLTGGYGYNRQTADAGFSLQNRAYGFNYGVTLSFNIFDGLNTNRRRENARVEEKIALLNYEQVRQQLGSYFEALFNTYRNNVTLAKLEESNSTAAYENYMIAADKYRAGSISAIEFRDAELSYISSRNRAFNANYNAKAAETELLKLTNRLL